MQEFIKSLNPKEDEKHILIYGKEYKLWRDGQYIGTAFWTKDENVGDSFQMKKYDPKTDRNVNKVYVADSWELIVNH
ncbi:hypothetical protein [Chryseobacterium sp.]|uniref:hypothetical protein n=1 Tax=Chryseobacterium sp. TaxID=1871047 RepID=UPI0024E24A28|nr:hypothetical protein [Chryseobacterium sp.]